MNDQFPFVVGIGGVNANLGGTFCSGTLVSPTRVISAAHCFWNQGGSSANIDLLMLTHTPGGGEVVTRLTHRLLVSGPITLLSNGPNDNLRDRGSDIAIIPLDNPIFSPSFPFVANPVSPCPSSFTGTLVGFGPILGSWPSCGIIDDGRRNFATSGPWELTNFSTVAVYIQGFSFEDYKGSLPGDSGGGLFLGNTLCGVVSGHSDLECFPIPVGGEAWLAAPQGGASVTSTIQQGISWTDPRTGETSLMGMCPASYLGGSPQSESTIIDGDHDNVPDLCDTCPSVANRGQMQGIEADSDGDGVPNVCDKCPGKPDVDSDGDGQLDCMDSCPCSPGVGDADEDGVCNSCDPNLTDPNAKVPVNLCAKHCSKQIIDNCTDVKNTAQLNCNDDAERARNALSLGDACDPVPCPGFQPTHDTTVLSYSLEHKGYSGGIVIIEKYDEIIRAKGLELSPFGSHGTPDSSLSGTEVSTLVPSTPYRFCFNSLPEIDCKADENVGDFFLSLTNNRAEEDEGSVWHRVALGGLTIGQDEPAAKYFHGQEVASRAWNWQGDFAYWSAQWPEKVPGVPSASYTGEGRFWAHARTLVGVTDLSQNTGFHGLKSAPTLAAPGLANHYEPTTVFEFRKVTNVNHMTPTKEDLILAAHPCPTCPPPELALHADCPQCGLIQNRLDYDDIWMSQLITGFRDLPESVGVKLRDGRVQNADSSLSKKVRQHLTDPLLRIVGQAEPSATIGQGAALPLALALSKDGTSVQDTLTLRGRSMQAGSDACRSRCTTNEVPFLGAILQGPDAASLAAADDPTPQGPPPRENFQAVYSRAIGAVFVVGGTLLGTNEPIKDLWRGSAEGGWTQIKIPSYEPQKVVSATYSFRDGKLWVLDNFKAGWEWARLVRINIETQEAEILGVWPKLGFYNRHWLLVDQDGSVLFVASSDKINKHTVIRLDNSGPEVKISLARMAPKSLAFAPVVDSVGYWFAAGNAKKPPKLERLKTLEAKGGKWSHLAECL